MERVEDAALLTGRGRFADDVGERPGTAHAAVLRSPHAHAEIVSLDAAAALSMPEVVIVLTGAKVAAWSRPFIAGVKQPMRHYALAVDRVRYTGEPVAVVVARDRYAAEDALERIEVEYRELDPVVDPVAAAAPGAPLLHRDVGSNVVSDRRFRYGDPDAAFASAAHRVAISVRYPRNACTPIEGFVDVQLSTGLVPVCPACAMAPVRAMAIAHVFGDIGGALPDPPRRVAWPQALVRTPRASCSRRCLQIDQLDPLSVAPEILDVQRQQSPLAMRQHGRRNVGIVDLLARDGNLAAEHGQRRHDVRTVLEHGERRYQPRCVLQRVVDGERCRPGLRACDRHEVLADDLTADEQGFTTVAGTVEAAAGGDMGGGGHEAGRYKNVGVDRDHYEFVRSVRSTCMYAGVL